MYGAYSRFLENIVVGCPMYILQHRLKRLKIELKNWNKISFGNIQNEVILKYNSLLAIQQRLETANPPVLETLTI